MGGTQANTFMLDQGRREEESQKEGRNPFLLPFSFSLNLSFSLLACGRGGMEKEACGKEGRRGDGAN